MERGNDLANCSTCKSSKPDPSISAMPREHAFPEGTVPLDSQVGGHEYCITKDTIGMLRDRNGCVLKPVEKPLLGEREIAFYEQLRSSGNSSMLELLRYTPKYYGTMELQINNKRVNFLILKDITEGMSEPCVMDIKIGRRTWDPLAGPDKKAAEEQKYAESKRAYGFCIPGFQVHHLSTGRTRKYGKEFGKKLNEKTLVEAIRIFLNAAPDQPPCRYLIMQLLSSLWKILAFFRSQRNMRFYSSSLLIAYDAKHLRHSIFARSAFNETHATPMENTTNHRTETTPANDKTKLLRCSNTRDADTTKSALSAYESSRLRFRREQRSLDTLHDSFGTLVNVSANAELYHARSVTNNLGKVIVESKDEHGAASLDESYLVSSEKQENWVRVKMIDFTHVFPAEDNDLDINYLEGLENLIKLLETFIIS